MSEVDDILARFMEELKKPTADGKKKRSGGNKPPWYEDDSHEAALFSHLRKWKAGELVDPDSGAHPLVHAAWRLLAIACQETDNTPLAEKKLKISAQYYESYKEHKEDIINAQK